MHALSFLPSNIVDPQPSLGRDALEACLSGVDHEQPRIRPADETTVVAASRSKGSRTRRESTGSTVPLLIVHRQIDDLGLKAYEAALSLHLWRSRGQEEGICLFTI